VDLPAVTIPGSVLEGAGYVAAAARDVRIRDDALADIAGPIDARLAAGIDDVDVAFGSAGTLARDVNLIMFETACNFCFWGERPEDAWRVDVGGTVLGGWYGLAACFNSAARGGMPVWDAEWMARLTVERAHRLFAGIGPQLMAPEGSVRPYIAGTIGFSRFSTETAINIPASQSNSGTTEQLDQQTISSDFIMSLTGTAGIAFHVGFLGNSAMGDLGVRYHHNGLARYVSSDGVQYNGTGDATVTPTTSDANFLTYRIGVVIPIR